MAPATAPLFCDMTFRLLRDVVEARMTGKCRKGKWDETI